MRVLLATVLLGMGANAWADTTVGATDNTTAYLGAKSEAYAINSNGTWTFAFTNHNSGSGSTWNNWLLECSNGVCDEFVLRADRWEVVRGANTNITTTYAGSNLVTDLNGAAVSMTVTRDGNHIAVAATITPATEAAAYNYSYDFYTASGNLNLYLSVDHSYITISSASWASSVGTITETEVVNCDFENGETLFTVTSGENNSTTVSNVNNDDIESKVLSLASTGKTSKSKYSFAKYDFSSLTSDANLVKVSYDCWFQKVSVSYGAVLTIGDNEDRSNFSTTDIGATTTGSIFNLGNLRSKNGGGTNYDWFSINGVCKDHDTDPAHLGVWLHVEAMVDLINSKVSYKVQNYDRTAIYFKDYDIDYMNASPEACTQIDVFQAQNQGTTTIYLDNLVITKYIDNSAVPTTYTIKYENSAGTTLKSSRVVDTYVGVDYTAISSDMATFYNGDESKKYVYKSGNEEKTTTATASENVITLVFDEYDKVAYTIKAKNGDDELKTLASGNAYTDGSTTVYWNKFIEVAGQWYVTTNPYGKAITEAGNTDISYTPSDICGFIECESTSYTTAGDQTSTGASGGIGVLLQNDKAMTTTSKIAAGVYDISVYAYVRRSNPDGLKLQYSTDNSEWNDVTTLNFESNKASTETAEKVILAEDSYIRFVDATSKNSCHYYDYITLKESTVSASISSYGYATFSSTYAVDFTGVAGLKAYKATACDGSKATMTEVTGAVAANTGLVLKGAEGTYSIPVAASGTALGDNLLEDCDGSWTTLAVANFGTNYVLSVQGGKVVWAPVTDGDHLPTMSAGQAYLYVPDGEARALTMVFDDDLTGINSVKSDATLNDGAVYNLRGQRVAQPTKGLYIVNGKKVIVK